MSLKNYAVLNGVTIALSLVKCVCIWWDTRYEADCVTLITTVLTRVSLL